MGRAEDEAEIRSGAKRWMSGELGSGWTLDGTRQLTGRRASAVYFVDATSPQGRRHRLVLKLFPPDDEPEVIQTEICGVRTADRASVPVPDIVASDSEGALGTACILMARLPGRPIVRPQAGWASLVTRLAALMRTIHSADVTSTTLGAYEPHELDEPHPAPSTEWTTEAWERCVHSFRSHPPDHPVGFLHRDYHPGNVLWTPDRLSGVVDWSAACIGSPWADVAHCRFNLWRWHGEAAADAIVAEYQRLRPELPPYHPYWDIATAMSIPWSIRDTVLRSAVERLASHDELRPRAPRGGDA